MATRVCLPGELHLDAVVVHPDRQLAILGHQQQGDDFGAGADVDLPTLQRVKARPPHVALRWVLNPALGIPLAPFTVWRRPAALRDPAQQIEGLHQAGGRFAWDGVSEMLRLEVDLSGPATVRGVHRADLDPVQTVTGGAGQTVVLDAGPMLGLRVDAPGSVADVRGQSLVLLANGANWRRVEVVGLPFTHDQVAGTYYDGSPQGPDGTALDPFDAAVLRLDRWGPVLGWAPLLGLPPWVPPDSRRLVQEMQDDVLADLAQVLGANPPPLVAAQLKAQVVHDLLQLRQVIGTRARALGGAAPADRSQVGVRPLQALATAVAGDAWASLALGFGTGDALQHDEQHDDKGQGYDYMVTAPWDGMLQRAVRAPWPWPWGGPDPVVIEEQVQRELAAVVLSPGLRTAPAAPTPLTASLGHDEGADAVDQPYTVSTVLQTPRPPTLPGRSRAAAYGLARYDAPGRGSYQLREHRLAGGWIPVTAAAPVLEPGTAPDPRTPPDTVTLRDSGVPRPISGPPNTFEYYAAATDLFGQWSSWSTAWYSLPAAHVQAPVVVAVRADAVPGPGDSDPCSLTVTTEVVWTIRERSLRRLTLAVDVFTPAPPPAPYDPPPPSPQGGSVTMRTLILDVDLDGTPVVPTPPATDADVGVALVHDDDTPVDATHPASGDDRRYRITIPNISVTFGARPEVAVVVYAAAEETRRLGTTSDWAHAREAAIAPNPVPPPPHKPLSPVYPEWASLPDAAGRSFASVSWTPFGAWRYRVYEATEAALLAACGKPGPVLTDGFGQRMQALFDLFADTDNLPSLKRAFRKLGTEPVLPPIGPDGRMRFDSPLPRGSALIHCYVVVGVTESNVISGWPVADVHGRRGFDGYAIPHPRRVAPPQIRAALDAAGPQVTVLLDGAVAATSVRLYRATNAVLARSVGTMTLVATVPPGSDPPEGWKRTVVVDPGAPVGWRRLQYRAVADTADDLDRAAMAVPSEASRSYALLNPPPNPPTLVLTPNVPGTTVAVSIVRVDTDAERRPGDIGDFALAATVTPSVGPARFSSPLSALSEFTSTDALAVAADVAGYVGGVVYLRVPRTVGGEFDLAVDVTDPLGRATHAIAHVPAEVPDPPPEVALDVQLAGGVVVVRIDTNVPLPPDPAHEWVLEIATRRVFDFPPLPPVVRQFPVSTIPTIPNEAAMPDPALDPAPFEIRRVDATGRILAWGRGTGAIRLGVRLTDPEGDSATASQVVP